MVKPLIWPYYKAVQQANPYTRIYLIEDNAKPHRKSRKFLEREAQDQGILWAKWPPNSPQLQSIEYQWDYLKDMLVEPFAQIKGSSKEAKQQAYKAIREEWELAREHAAF